ncbi:hypothetical protein RGQ29_029846 [Quercus rubra]|uniref:Longin domain-containing protein n=1 Tax=Quercus rubra TaxID=3512 RepID=A0AAN7IGL5_QUERU|nr:hypothetical protein RGQ29_029846 [Quercus rubra]
MITNPELIQYVCIAKGTTILSQFIREPDLESVALKCIEKTPPLHSMFTHTIRKRTYTFLIKDPFVYFAIFDENMEQSQQIWFLNRIKCAFEEVIEAGALKGVHILSPYCLQKECDPIFLEAMALDLSMLNSSGSESKYSRNPSMDSTKGMKVVMTPLLGSKPSKGLQKKKKRPCCAIANGDSKSGTLEKKVDVFDDVDGGDFSLPVQKAFANDRQKSKQIWRKHVWVVLLLDLFVCSVLFVIWLCICRGFKCVES